MKTNNFISIHDVKYVSQFPQQISFLDILRPSLKFSNIDAIPLSWINICHIWSIHNFFEPINLLLTQNVVFPPFFFDRTILILFFFARETITPIFLSWLYDKLSSAGFKLRQQDYLVEKRIAGGSSVSADFEWCSNSKINAFILDSFS